MGYNLTPGQSSFSNWRVTANGNPTRFEVALFSAENELETANHQINTLHEISLSLWKSRALRHGEGPPRPLQRPTLPQGGRVKKKRYVKTYASSYQEFLDSNNALP